MDLQRAPLGFMLCTHMRSLSSLGLPTVPAMLVGTPLAGEPEGKWPPDCISIKRGFMSAYGLGKSTLGLHAMHAHALVELAGAPHDTSRPVCVTYGQVAAGSFTQGGACRRLPAMKLAF